MSINSYMRASFYYIWPIYASFFYIFLIFINPVPSAFSLQTALSLSKHSILLSLDSFVVLLLFCSGWFAVSRWWANPLGCVEPLPGALRCGLWNRECLFSQPMCAVQSNNKEFLDYFCHSDTWGSRLRKLRLSRNIEHTAERLGRDAWSYQGGRLPLWKRLFKTK